MKFNIILIMGSLIIYSNYAYSDVFQEGYAAAAKKDFATAIKKFQLASETKVTNSNELKKVAEANFMIAQSYHFGYGVEVDMSEAIK